MLRHGEIWAAIDRLAESKGFSPSGLARRAGLDPTTFNKSKRFSGTRPRWPSTESLAKVLEATGTSLGEFVALMDGGGFAWRLPVIGWADARHPAGFDAGGRPAGDKWQPTPLAGAADGSLFGLRVDTDEMWPIYRRGDIIVVSPEAMPEPGTRVFVRTRYGEVMVRRLHARGSGRIELESLDPGAKIREIQAADILAMQRVILTSQ